MNNDEVYSQGLLQRALDPASQPAEIRSFLADELAAARQLLGRARDVLDFGCGSGRHLLALRDCLYRGVGFDYDERSIAQAVRRSRTARNLSFFVADARAVPIVRSFDAAVCLTNTLGTMNDEGVVLDEMRRLSPRTGSRLVTVYAATSVQARSEWYSNMGHRVLHATETEVVAEGGFTSQHFTEERVRSLFGACQLHRLGDVAFVVQF